MVGLWLRAAAHSPEYHAPALIYAIGLIIAQALWVVMYFTITPESAIFIPICMGIFMIELLVPVASGLVKGIPFHRHHVIERYGLLNILVLGEVLLSISFMFGELYDGHFTGPWCLRRWRAL
jgi:low temperature requirement protein LtrA